MSVEEERALAEATSGACKGDPDGSVLVLPRFDYNTKEKGLGGCSGCLSIKPKQDQDWRTVWTKRLQEHAEDGVDDSTLHHFLLTDLSWENLIELMFLGFWGFFFRFFRKKNPSNIFNQIIKLLCFYIGLWFEMSSVIAAISYLENVTNSTFYGF